MAVMKRRASPYNNVLSAGIGNGTASTNGVGTSTDDSSSNGNSNGNSHAATPAIGNSAQQPPFRFNAPLHHQLLQSQGHLQAPPAAAATTIAATATAAVTTSAATFQYSHAQSQGRPPSHPAAVSTSTTTKNANSNINTNSNSNSNSNTHSNSNGLFLMSPTRLASSRQGIGGLHAHSSATSDRATPHQHSVVMRFGANGNTGNGISNSISNGISNNNNTNHHNNNGNSNMSRRRLPSVEDVDETALADEGYRLQLATENSSESSNTSSPRSTATSTATLLSTMASASSLPFMTSPPPSGLSVPHLSSKFPALLNKQPSRYSSTKSILQASHRTRPASLSSSQSSSQPQKQQRQRNRSWSSVNSSSNSSSNSRSSLRSNSGSGIGSMVANANASNGATPLSILLASSSPSSTHSVRASVDATSIITELQRPELLSPIPDASSTASTAATETPAQHQSAETASPQTNGLLLPLYSVPRQLAGYFTWRNPVSNACAKPSRIILLLFTALVCSSGLWFYSQSHATLSRAILQMEAMMLERSSLHNKLQTAELELSTIQNTFRELHAATPHRRTSALDDEQQQKRQKEMASLQHKIVRGKTKIDTLQQHVQRICKHDILDKYGSDVQRVELTLEFPKTKTIALSDGASNNGLRPQAQQDQKPLPTKIVIELASVDVMPHSVFMFLEMVTLGLIDGCSFIIHAMNVVKAAAFPYDGSSRTAKVRAFAHAGLESVAFQEYSPQVPHEQYTVGFSVNEGPSFYINTQDNTEFNRGEPCFGKVIRGFDTVERLIQAPTRDGLFYRQRIGIKQARLMAPAEA